MVPVGTVTYGTGNTQCTGTYGTLCTGTGTYCMCTGTVPYHWYRYQGRYLYLFKLLFEARVGSRSELGKKKKVRIQLKKGPDPTRHRGFLPPEQVWGEGEGEGQAVHARGEGQGRHLHLLGGAVQAPQAAAPTRLL